jgi:DNA-binding NarL/FixJ family response regulator
MMKPIRILLAEDHSLVRQGIRALLERVDDVIVIGEVGDGMEAVRVAREERADIVLMDIKMPGLNGLDALLRLRTEYPSARVIVLSMFGGEEHFQKALYAGAAGYLLKGADRAELALAIETVAKGGTYLTPVVAQYAVDSYKNPKCRNDGLLATLTSRQREVLQLLAEGMTNKAIASRLSLSIRTVESHRAELMERLGVHDMPNLVLIALRGGLIDDPQSVR